MAPPRHRASSFPRAQRCDRPYGPRRPRSVVAGSPVASRGRRDRRHYLLPSASLLCARRIKHSSPRTSEGSGPIKYVPPSPALGPASSSTSTPWTPMAPPRRRQDATHRRPRLLRGPRTGLRALLPRLYLFHLVVPEQPRAAILRYYL